MRLLSILFLFFICSCTQPVKYNEVKVNSQYSLSIPEYMTPTGEMHKQASLQYQNTEKELYLVVIDENKEQMEAYDLNYDIETYYKNIISIPFNEALKNGKVSIPGRMDIDGNKALVSEITGTIDGSDIYYKLVVIESARHFYQIVLWTKQDYKEKMESIMDSIIQSFNEIEKAS
jgi:hypothetical protein